LLSRPTEEVMRETKIKFMRQEFESMERFKFQKTLKDPTKERRRAFDLIYLQNMVYLVIKEAVLDTDDEEIRYNLTLLRFNPTTKETQELMHE
jgi:hypothetical protein